MDNKTSIFIDDMSTNIQMKVLREQEVKQVFETIKTCQKFCLNLEQQKNVEDNRRLVGYLVKTKFSTVGISIDDLISEGSIGLIKAAATFNKDKNIKFATYASRCIENQILMYLRSEKKHKNISLNEAFSTDGDGGELQYEDILGTDSDIVSKRLEREDEIKEVMNCFRNINDKYRNVLIKRFGFNGQEPKSQREIAEEMGISQSYVSRIEHNAINKIRKLLKVNPTTLDRKMTRKK